ncbi:MAG: ATP-binding protein [Bacillota bacterium]
MVTILINAKEDFTKPKRGRPYLGLRWILLSTYLAVALLPLWVVSGSILESIETYFIEERKAELLSQANMIAGQLASFHYFDSAQSVYELEEIMYNLGQKENFRILIFDTSSKIIYDTVYQDVGQTLLIPEVLEALGGKNIANKQESDMLYGAVAILGERDIPDGAVLIVENISDIAMTIGVIQQNATNLTLSVVILILVGAFCLARIFTDPMKNVILAIQKMAEGHLDERVHIHGAFHNEIVDLGLACNHMAEQLEKVDQTRQQFVSNVSHELKTPLSSIKVLSESILLQEETEEAVYAEFFQDINSEVDRMSAIVNDLLNLVKLDQKEIPLQCKETDISVMMEGIIKRLQPLAERKEVLIEFTKEKEVSAFVDEMKLSLAIANIIDNAVKYTIEKGSISVMLDADHQNMFITVMDTGIGIPEDEVTHIFERFYRVDKTRDRETGGTGLGLSITYGTIMMHKGSIRVTSKEDEGTTMFVRIPLQQNPNQGAVEPDLLV